MVQGSSAFPGQHRPKDPTPPLSKRVFSPCLYKQSFAHVLSEPGRLYGVGTQESMAGVGQRPGKGPPRKGLQGSQQCGPGPFWDSSSAGAEVQVVGASADHTTCPQLARPGGAGCCLVILVSWCDGSC